MATLESVNVKSTAYVCSCHKSLHLLPTARECNVFIGVCQSFSSQSTSWLLSHCSSLLWRGRYASYWNAFLLGFWLFHLRFLRCIDLPKVLTMRHLHFLGYSGSFRLCYLFVVFTVKYKFDEETITRCKWLPSTGVQILVLRFHRFINYGNLLIAY